MSTILTMIHQLARSLLYGRSRPRGIINGIKLNYGQRRFLDLQEYQSKQILYEHGVEVQHFKVVSNREEIENVFHPHLESKRLTSRWSGTDKDITGSEEFVIKAQILAGGRGKGYFKNSSLQGGVKITDSESEAIDLACRMLNDNLVTKQTGKEGVLVQRVMIAEAVRLVKEFYFAILFDRTYDKGPILVASPKGGMDIEEVAAQDDTVIKRFTIPIDLKLDFDTARRIAMTAFDLSLTELDIIDQCAREITKLHSMFLKLDATQIEINPLGVTTKRRVISVDAKIKLDEAARFRHEWLGEIERMNQNEIDKREFEAHKHNLNFIGLDGSIGCLVNGAGLAMATMDLIKLHGGEPANFLDVGGGATADQVTAALKIIHSDTNVRAILVNIFGGIMRCDTVAKGIIEAYKKLQLNLPIVVRLEGTLVEEAESMIRDSNLNIVTCDNFDQAARKAIDLGNV